MAKRRIAASAGLIAVGALVFTGLNLAGCHHHHRGNHFEMVDQIATFGVDLVMDRIEATKEQRREFHAAKDWILDEIELMAIARKPVEPPAQAESGHAQGG